MTFLKQGRAELVNQHSDGWRNDRKAATTVIGRKPGESCLMSLQDDRNSPAAAGQENGAETTRIPERWATAFAEARHSLESGSGVFPAVVLPQSNRALRGATEAVRNA
jgi:hypothetical protein